MADALFLGLDVGSSSTKGVLVDELGRLEAAVELPHGISRPRAGWAEHDAEQDWWASSVEVCRRLVDGRSRRVAAVGVSGLGPCLLPTDASGRPLRPAILYGIDTRASESDRAADRRARSLRDPRPLRVSADESVGRSQAALARGRGAGGVVGHPTRLRREPRTSSFDSPASTSSTITPPVTGRLSTTCGATRGSRSGSIAWLPACHCLAWSGRRRRAAT